MAVVEQPVCSRDDAGQARLAAVYAERHHIDVVADERVRSAEQVVTAAANRVAGCANVGISKLGGVAVALDAATVARAARLKVSVGSVVELGVATAAGMQLAAALPEIAASRVAIPTGPGLGVEVDEEAVAALDLRATA